MIEVTRFNGKALYVNPHQIELVELKPDTTITMLSGRQLIVREDYQLLYERIMNYRKEIAPLRNEE